MKAFATIFLAASVALLASARNIQQVEVKIVPESAYDTTTPLPYAVLYENVNRGGNHIFFNLVKGHCYKATDIGILNNVASQFDTFNNCIDVFDAEDCTLQAGGATVRIYADTPKRCLENLNACVVDMDNKISSFRTC